MRTSVRITSAKRYKTFVSSDKAWIAMLRGRIECFKTVVLLFVVSHCYMGAKYGIRVASDTAF